MKRVRLARPELFELLQHYTPIEITHHRVAIADRCLLSRTQIQPVFTGVL